MPVMKIRTDCAHCGKSAEFRTDPATAALDPGTGNLVVRLTCPVPACGKEFPFPLNTRRGPTAAAPPAASPLPPPAAPAPAPEVLDLPDDPPPPVAAKRGPRRTAPKPAGRRPKPPPPPEPLDL
jgi:pilus assembly protein FimV